MKKNRFAVFGRLRMLLTLAICFSANIAAAQAIVGKWKTLDDETGEPKSIVVVYQEGDLLFGKIESIYREANEDPNPLCTACTGEKQNKPIIGLLVFEGLKKTGDEWTGGKILDPESGKAYNCRLWLDGKNKLKVRGYWGFFYRTQTWVRVQ